MGIFPFGKRYGMNTKQTTYEPDEDQNQGIVGTMARNSQPTDTELVGTRMPRLNPNIVTNQSGAAIEDDDESAETDESESDATDDEEEPGDNDHHQDDNYALGGHVTRSGGV